MNTCAFVELHEETPSKASWVRKILVLGHLAIIIVLLAIANSHRTEPPKGVPSGHSILECLRGADTASIR